MKTGSRSHQCDELVAIDRHLVRGMTHGAYRRKFPANQWNSFGEAMFLSPRHSFGERAAAPPAPDDEIYRDREPRIIRHGTSAALPPREWSIRPPSLRQHRDPSADIENPGFTPGPRSQDAPVIHLAWLPFVYQPDNSFGKPRAIVGLDLVELRPNEAPSFLKDQLAESGGLGGIASPYPTTPGVVETGRGGTPSRRRRPRKPASRADHPR